MKAHKNSTHVCLSRILVTSRQACTFTESYSYSSLAFGLAGSPKYSVTRKNISRHYTLNPPIRYMYCLGDRKFWISCVVWGSEILYPLPWCVGDQKFWISCVVWGIRNSVSSPVVCGGSEILKLLCCLRDQKFWTLHCVYISVKTISFTSSQFYTHFQGNFKICNVKKCSSRHVSILNGKGSHFWSGSQCFLWILPNWNTTFYFGRRYFFFVTLLNFHCSFKWSV